MLASLSAMAQSKDRRSTRGEVPSSSTGAAAGRRAAPTCAGAPATGRQRTGEVKSRRTACRLQVSRDVVGRVHLPDAAARQRAAPPHRPLRQKCDFTSHLCLRYRLRLQQATLTPAAKAHLDSAIIAKLSSCAEVTAVSPSPYRPPPAPRGYNQKLSDRADAVRAYLVSRGIKADVIDTMGTGKTADQRRRQARPQRADPDASPQPPRHRGRQGTAINNQPLSVSSKPRPARGFPLHAENRHDTDAGRPAHRSPLDHSRGPDNTTLEARDRGARWARRLAVQPIDEARTRFRRSRNRQLPDRRHARLHQSPLPRPLRGMHARPGG